MNNELRISEYWDRQGKTLSDRKPGQTFDMGTYGKGCAECCNHDRCRSDGDECFLYHRQSCPYCLGTNKNLSC